MDKQQLLVYFQDHYLSRQDVLYKLPLNISIDSFWQDLVNQRKARATMLPLYSATGQPYSAEAVARAIEAEPDEQEVEEQPAPDPPDIPDGDASFRASQSQAGSTQADSENAAIHAAGDAPGGDSVTIPLPAGGTCPSLLGLTDELLGKLGKMLEANITPFTSSQWAHLFGCSHAEAKPECNALYSLGLVDRNCFENALWATM